METIISKAAPVCDIPDDIDRDALAILREAAFAWDADLLAFRRSSATIEYSFLRAQKLVLGTAMTAQERYRAASAAADSAPEHRLRIWNGAVENPRALHEGPLQRRRAPVR